MNQNWKKQFIIIYTGQAFSLLSSSAIQFAIIWWLTVKTESPIVLTIATLFAFLPNIIIGPFAGVLIDRYNRRTVMIVSDALVALSSLILCIAFIVTPSLPIWFIYIILFLRGVGNTFHAPAMQASIPMFVPEQMLTKVGGWANFIVSISNMLGPVLGAILMAIFPMSIIMLVDIFGAAFAIICLLFITIPNIPQTDEKIDLFSNLKEGVRAIKMNKPLVSLLFPMTLVSVVYMPLGSLFPLLVRVQFLGEAWHNSIVEFVFAGGLLISSVVIGMYGGMKRRFFMISLSIGLLGISSLISGILPTDYFWLFVVCCFFMGCAGTFINVPFIAYIQESIEPEVMGKVLSLVMTVMTMAIPIGLIIAGPISKIIGVNRWFFWSGVAIVAVSIICYLSTKKFDK